MARTAIKETRTLARTILDASAVSPLPTLGQGKDQAATKIGLEAARREWGVLGPQNFAASTKQGVSGILVHTGTITTFDFDDFVNWIQTAEYIVNDEIDALIGDNWESENIGELLLAQIMELDIVKELIGKLADMGMELLGGVIEMVPVIGWLVGSAIEIGTTVSAAIKQQRAEAFPDLRGPLAFNGTEDVLVFNNFVIPALNSGHRVQARPLVDWTELFLPPGDPAGAIGLLSPFGRQLQQDFTVAFTQRQPLGLGIIPGSAVLHQGIDIDRQGTITDIGQFLPTSAQQAAWLWTRATLNDPALFSVDAKKLRTYWSLYLEDLRQYFAGEFQDDPLGMVEFPDKGTCDTYLGKSRCKKSDGGGHGRFGQFVNQSDIDKIIDHYAHPSLFGWADSKGRYRRLKDGSWRAWTKADDDPWGTRESIPIEAAEMVADRQRKALGTMTVAYVDETYVAIAKDADLKKLWQQRRGQLLQHPARCHVDLDSVATDWDGGIWREALEKSGVGVFEGPCGPGGVLAAIPVPSIEDPPLPTGPQGSLFLPPPPDVGRPRRRRRRLSKQEAVMIAIVAGGTAAWKGPELVQMASSAIRRRRP